MAGLCALLALFTGRPLRAAANIDPVIHNPQSAGGDHPASINAVDLVHVDHWSRREQITLGACLLAMAGVMYLALRQRDLRRRHHIEALERLNEIALAIASVPGQELRPVLDRLAGAARQQLAMPMSCVMLLDETQPRIIHPVHVHGVTHTTPEPAYHLDNMPATDECLRSGKAVLILDSHRDAHGVTRSMLDRAGLRAAVVTPLRAGGKSIGVLVLADTRPRRIDETDRHLIELWGAQAAVSIVNSRLYTQMDEAIRSLRRERAQRDTNYQMSTAVQGAKTLDEALTRVADLAPTALEADVCIVCLRPEPADKSDGHSSAGAGADSGTEAGAASNRSQADEAPGGEPLCVAAVTALPYPFPLSPGMTFRSAHAARAMKKHRPVALEDVSQDTEPREPALPQTGSALYLPLIARSPETIGALVLLRHRGGAFVEQTIRLAEMFSQRAATTIENARLHDRARRDADTNATLLHELNHRVKNNLAGLVGLLSMQTPQMPPDAQRWLGRVIDRIGAMARAHELFSAAGGGAGGGGAGGGAFGDGGALVDRAVVRLRALIETTLDSIAAVKPEDVRVSIDLRGVENGGVENGREATGGGRAGGGEAGSGADDAVLPADQAVPLAMVIYELAYNALVHGVGDAGELRVRAARIGGKLRIEVIDDGGRCAQLVGAGAGFETDSDRFGSRSGPGEVSHGVGLNLVRGLVARELHGSFTLSSAPDGGTIAAVTLPALDRRREQKQRGCIG